MGQLQLRLEVAPQVRREHDADAVVDEEAGRVVGRHAGAQGPPDAAGLPSGIHSGGDPAGTPPPPCRLFMGYIDLPMP